MLPDAQVENLLALPIDEPLLVRHRTLDGADLAAIERRRREHNQGSPDDLSKTARQRAMQITAAFGRNFARGL